MVDESGSVVASWIGGGREAPRGIVPEQRGARRGVSFATASTHAPCSASQGARGSDSTAPHWSATSSTTRDESSRRGLEEGAKLHAGSFPSSGCRAGQQLRDSTHSRIRQCLAITRPPVTRQPGPSKGRVGADNTAASPAPPRPRVGMSRRGADSEEALGSTGDRSQRNGVPERAAASRQHLLMRPAVPRHHAATNDTPTRSLQGARGSRQHGGLTSATASTSQDESSRRGPEAARGSTGDRSQRNGAPERAAASRQHLLMRPAVPRHHAATNDTPSSSSKGAGGG